MRSQPGPCISTRVSVTSSHEYAIHRAEGARAGFNAYTISEGLAGTDEETSTNRTSNGDHVEVALLHGTVELDDAETIVALPERREIQTIPGHKVLVADGCSGVLRPVAASISGEDLGRRHGGLLEVRAVRRLMLFLHDAEHDAQAFFVALSQGN